MAKVKRQTYTLDMYLKKVRDLDIRADQDVQRMANQWNNSMSSELIVSVLNGEYVPPLILGTENNSQSWLIDGLQRSSTLMMFRYGNLKISPNIEEPVIKYRAKVRDADGEVKIDGCGDICWETRTFDVRRKTYERLPEELKRTFDEYQVECVIHEDYSMQQISRLVRRFNYHKPMNISQKAFTFCDKYARRIREILKREFFIGCTGYTKNERKNGSLERIIMETIMCTNHLDNWKKSAQIGAFVNENASPEEFDSLENNIARLENIITDDLYNLFTSKDSFLLFTLFDRFGRLNIDDEKFADFLHAFKNGLCNKEVNGKFFNEIDKERSTKDKTVIVKKLDLLETLMHEFLGISKPEFDSEEVLAFVREHVSPDIMPEDISQYSEVLDALMKKSNGDTKLMEDSNRPSLIAIVAYSFKNDIDLDDWISYYCSRNNNYISDQAENYLYMRNDLQQFLKLENVA